MKYIVLVLLFVIQGCAYRSSENLNADQLSSLNVVLSESHIKGKKYKAIGPVSVDIKKTTIFNADPTEEMANELLKAKAKQMGADAVINVRYDSGIGLLTWGYIEATGIAVKFINE